MQNSPLPAADFALIERFVAAFNSIDQYLQGALGSDERSSFRNLVDVYAHQHKWWRDAERLRVFAQLRNILVHDKTRPYDSLCVPTLATVEEIEAIRDALINPPRVIPAFARQVMIISPQDSLAHALTLIDQHHYSRLPVYDGAQFVGLLTENGITRWLAHWVAAIGSPPNFHLAVQEILPREQKRANFQFVARTTPIDEVAFRFHDNTFLEAALITRQGEAHAAVTGHHHARRCCAVLAITCQTKGVRWAMQMVRGVIKLLLLAVVAGLVCGLLGGGWGTAVRANDAALPDSLSSRGAVSVSAANTPTPILKPTGTPQPTPKPTVTPTIAPTATPVGTPAPTKTPAPLLTISGRITTGTGAALSNVRLTRSGSTVAATTDSKGNFAFAGLVAATYVLTPVRSGFTFNPPTMVVTLRTSSVGSVVFIGVQPPYVIGRVANSAGVGVPDAGVLLTNSVGIPTTQSTNTGGYYGFSLVPNGNYNVTCGKASYSFLPPVIPVTISASLPTANANFLGLPAPSLSGRIINSLGVGIGGVVIVRRNSLGVAVATTSNANGYYGFPSTPPGTYTLTPQKSGLKFSPTSSRPVTVTSITGTISVTFLVA